MVTSNEAKNADPSFTRQYGRTPESAPLLSEGYTETIKTLSQRRLAVAGTPAG